MADDLDTILGTRPAQSAQTQNSGFGSAAGTTGLSLLPNEKFLLVSDSNTLLLTTHRVRYDTQRVGSGSIISIMLDELASCAMVRQSKPFLLFLAAAFVLFSLYLDSNHQQDLAHFGFIVAALLVVAYFVTRRQIIELASAGAIIRVNTAGMSLQTVRSFIDQAEAAKNARYLLGRPGAG